MSRMIDADKLKDWLNDGNSALAKSLLYNLSDIFWMIDQQPTVDEWIPVTERLPEDGEDVLITWQDKDGTKKEFVSSRNGLGLGVYSEIKRWNIPPYHSQSGVVAWKPLPTPYVSEREED